MTRNERIYRDYQDGGGLLHLCHQYDITRQRVYQIVKKMASENGESLRRGRNGNRQRLTVPAAVLKDIADGKLYMTEGAIMAGVSVQTIKNRLREADVYVIRKRYEIARHRYAQTYSLFMAGATMKELAESEGV